MLNFDINIIELINSNDGLLTLILFVVTAIAGWISGIFRNLRHKAHLKIELLEPSFCCTFSAAEQEREIASHITCILLYLKVLNNGTAPTSICGLECGIRDYTVSGTFFPRWLKSVPALRDFGHTIGENLRVFPFLIQRSILTNSAPSTYLREGELHTGMVYFEHPESWGGYANPRVKNGKVRIFVRVNYAGGTKVHKFWIPTKPISDARKYSPEFGKTLTLLSSTSFEEWTTS